MVGDEWNIDMINVMFKDVYGYGGDMIDDW